MAQGLDHDLAALDEAVERFRTAVGLAGPGIRWPGDCAAISVLPWWFASITAGNDSPTSGKGWLSWWRPRS